jgi:small multidrug resistance pump
MGWQLLVMGALLEAAGSICLRLSQGLSKLSLVSIGLLCFVASVVPLAMAVRRVELSSAFALWSARDILLVSLVGIVWLQESATATKILALALILAGVVLLNLHPHTA